ncbi:uncharacterized protein LOC110875955 [Helianthus annuus]|uniref:uncharacterized protein LOC110875955 n=1 Tax=Helianthus annuus TaxID=4232 RepID=UPI000B902E59|nr:uncharacterized protein LOC110875955 [Helianthus annuus]
MQKNVWAKFGFSRLMMNSNGFFFFKFDSAEGMAKVLEGGPWLIRKNPLFLNVWSPSVILRKEGIKTVPVWVKFHNVPIAVYTDDGLSLLASKIGVPKRLVSYTADMCMENWGRTSFARAMIEVSADNELKDHIVVAIPKLDEGGYVTEKVKVEYEWKPQRCSECYLFGHCNATCPKAPNVKTKQVTVDDEGFVTDTRKTAKYGFPQKKPKAKFIYRQKADHSKPSSSGTKHDDGEGNKNQGSDTAIKSNLNLRNSFSALSNDQSLDGDVGMRGSSSGNLDTSYKKDDGVMEQLQTEISDFMNANTNGKHSEGASTPGQVVFNG